MLALPPGVELAVQLLVLAVELVPLLGEVPGVTLVRLRTHRDCRRKSSSARRRHRHAHHRSMRRL